MDTEILKEEFVREVRQEAAKLAELPLEEQRVALAYSAGVEAGRAAERSTWKE